MSEMASRSRLLSVGVSCPRLTSHVSFEYSLEYTVHLIQGAFTQTEALFDLD